MILGNILTSVKFRLCVVQNSTSQTVVTLHPTLKHLAISEDILMGNRDCYWYFWVEATADGNIQQPSNAQWTSYPHKTRIT